VKHLKAVLVGALTLYSLSWDCLAAAPSNDVRTETVRFADLDLTRPAGAHELYRRIQQAARDVCEPYRLGDIMRSYRLCLSSTIARAVAEVGAPLLTEHHQSQSHPAILQIPASKVESSPIRGGATGTVVESPRIVSP
jgi:UrcA family protein